MKTFKLEFDPTCSCALEKAHEMNVDFAHGCNTRGAMASGVAAAVAKAYVNLVAADKWVSLREEICLGQTLRVINSGSTRDNRSYIYNFYTQMNPGPGSLSYSAIENCFKIYFKTRLEERDDVRLIIPEIGCGLGGGFRLKVLYHIRKALDNIVLPSGKSITIIMRIWGDGHMRGWTELQHEAQWVLTSELEVPIDTLLVNKMSSESLLGETARSLNALQILDYLEGV